MTNDKESVNASQALKTGHAQAGGEDVEERVSPAAEREEAMARC